MSFHVVFVRTDRLGETLLTLPALHALRAARPDCRLTVVVHPALRELLADHPDVTEVVAELTPQGSWWSQAWRLGRVWRSWKAQAILISNPKKTYHLAAWLAGIPCRVGYDRKWGGLLTHRLPDRKALGDRHEVEYNLDLVKTLGIPVALPPVLQLPVRASDDARVDRLLGPWHVRSDHRLVAVHPWTSNPRKQWPLERFRTLLQRLQQVPTVRPVLIGGLEESRRLDEVLSPQAASVVNLVGQVSLGELAAVLRRVRVLVSNDSGPMHVAAAVGTKVVALFGTAEAGSHPNRWGPWGEGHTVIRKPLEHISVDDVMDAVTRGL